MERRRIYSVWSIEAKAREAAANVAKTLDRRFSYVAISKVPHEGRGDRYDYHVVVFTNEPEA